MKTEAIQEVLAWIKTTDLIEVAYRRGGDGFSFSTAPVPASAPYYFSGAKLAPVVSEAVGIFHWNEPGKGRVPGEGTSVAAGDVLGVVDLGVGKRAKVLAPSAGKLSKVCVDDGDPVQYGQPLFFIEC